MKKNDETSGEDEAVVLDDEEIDCSDFERTISPDELELDRISYQLPSSGRFIRNIKMAPPKNKRMWITPVQSMQLKRLLQKHHRTSPLITKLSTRRLIGEVIHITRPLAHLASGAMAGGFQKWLPFLLSLSLDVVSLRLLQGNGMSESNVLNAIMRSGSKTNKNDPQQVPVDEIWNWSEQLEIYNRYISLLMYLLRSPFYDQHLKQRLLRILSLFANHIPVFGRLLKPFIVFLPEWQRVYFHIWRQ